MRVAGDCRRILRSLVLGVGAIAVPIAEQRVLREIQEGCSLCPPGGKALPRNPGNWLSAGSPKALAHALKDLAWRLHHAGQD